MYIYVVQLEYHTTVTIKIDYTYSVYTEKYLDPNVVTVAL